MVMFERLICRVVNQQAGIAGSYIQQAILRLMERVDVVRLYWHCYILELSGFLIQYFDTIEERDMLTQFLDEDIIPPNSILLSGAPGVGKTYVAQWVSYKLTLPLVADIDDIHGMLVDLFV